MNVIPYGFVDLVLSGVILGLSVGVVHLDLKACPYPWLAQGVIQFLPEAFVPLPLDDRQYLFFCLLIILSPCLLQSGFEVLVPMVFPMVLEVFVLLLAEGDLAMFFLHRDSHRAGNVHFSCFPLQVPYIAYLPFPVSQEGSVDLCTFDP
jgi:hypothetical protein